ncbi:MAG: AAA family ATPase [Proteobacteria bacterium]|nr:AAA family ATPase [Pseudomonadota bacterium]
MRRKHTFEWLYKDQNGNTLGAVRRFDNDHEKEILPYFNKGENSFKIGIPRDISNNRPLYGIESITNKSKPVYIVEGEKCAHAMITLGFQTVTWLGGSKAIEKTNWQQLASIEKAILIPDNDDAGEATIKPIEKILNSIGSSIEFSIARLPNLPDKGDICDHIKSYREFYKWDEFQSLNSYRKSYGIIENSIEENTKVIPIEKSMGLPMETPMENKHKLTVLNFDEFDKEKLPEREILLYPWLYAQSTNMVFADRGLGKTYFCLSCAIALAEGSETLSYTATRPVKVLYLDGEMPASLLRDRIRGFIGNRELINKNLFIMTPDIQGDCIMPNMGEPDGLDAIDSIIDDISPDVIFVDNLSTFIRSGKENEGESWLPVQEWAIRQRSAGRSIVFVHHTNKEGGQRGSSRKEDILDVIIQLKKPENSIGQNDGANFETHYSKARHLYGDITKPIEAKLIDVDGKMEWSFDRTFSNQEKAIEMFRDGSKQKDICEALNAPKSTVSRWCKEA